MAFDGAGNLYVLDTGNRQVNVYARDSNKLLHTITQGVRTQGWSSPYFLALDRSGYLYVGNGNNYSSKGNTVTVYAPGSTDGVADDLAGHFRAGTPRRLMDFRAIST